MLRLFGEKSWVVPEPFLSYYSFHSLYQLFFLKIKKKNRMGCFGAWAFGSFSDFLSFFPLKGIFGHIFFWPPINHIVFVHHRLLSSVHVLNCASVHWLT